MSSQTCLADSYSLQQQPTEGGIAKFIETNDRDHHIRRDLSHPATLGSNLIGAGDVVLLSSPYGVLVMRTVAHYDPRQSVMLT